MTSLYQAWVDDQVLAFCGALLIGNRLPQNSTALEQANLARISAVIIEKWHSVFVSALSDNTLSLLKAIPSDYDVIDEDLHPDLQSLGSVRTLAAQEEERRSDDSNGISSLLIDHAAYLLRQKNLDAYRFLKWFLRNAGSSAGGGLRLLDVLSAPDSELRVRLDSLLDEIRNPLEQVRDRVRAIDDFYLYISTVSGVKADQSWLLRLCISLRSSLYCWPLMVGGSGGGADHGISLPIGVFISSGGNSSVFLKNVLPRGSSEIPPRYVKSEGKVPAHLTGSKLYWDNDWAGAIGKGAAVAKALWKSQNGRLRYVDSQTAEAKFLSSIVVDLGAACAIVDSVYSRFDKGSYELKGRSAEAYWAQVVLGLLLPGCELPFGVVTGRIDIDDGAFILRHVECVKEKLHYASNAGFSRVVLPGVARDYHEPDETLGGAGDPATDDKGISGPEPRVDNRLRALIEVKERLEREFQEKQKQDVRDFLRERGDGQRVRQIEINYCQNARAAADAMQPSGWRRAIFVRLPQAQQAFSYNLRRLFLKEQVERRQMLLEEDAEFYRENEWRSYDDRLMSRFDRTLLSASRSIKFVPRREFDALTNNLGESYLGKWLAWKDHQVRTGANDESGIRGPGLGLLCLRTSEADNEMRLWSALADLLSASPTWLETFQWAAPERAAQLVAALLGNRRADPDISLSSAPDLLVILDEGNLTQRRMNRIFPDDFRGNWLDLINPTRDDRQARWPLETALHNLGDGPLGRLRIIVIYGDPANSDDWRPPELTEDDKDLLSRLAVYRFGFSKQAAYAIINYNRRDADHISWSVVDLKLKEYHSLKILRYARGQYYFAPGRSDQFRTETHRQSGRAHYSAALALTPIIDPKRIAISSNRDRSLEPEPSLEALWHIRRANRLVPPRGTDELRQQLTAAQNNLIFLQPFADWDTVIGLQFSRIRQKNVDNKQDALELGRELLDIEMNVRGSPAHSSRVARLINIIGEFGSDKDDTTRDALSTEAHRRCMDALAAMRTSGAIDYQRQKVKLFSDYLYAMHKLKISKDDKRTEEAHHYLDRVVIQQVLQSDFFGLDDPEFDRLDNYPVSQAWLRSIWSDPSVTIERRAQAATVATRVSIKRARDVENDEPSRDGPWCDLFALCSPDHFDASDVRISLNTWDFIYGSDEDRLVGFSKRLLDSNTFRPRNPSETISKFGSTFERAIENLWLFITSNDKRKHLSQSDANVALKFIRVVGLAEVIPLYSFIRRRGTNWFWSILENVRDDEPGEVRRFSQEILKSQAAWVRLLSTIDGFENGHLLIRGWLERLVDVTVDRLTAHDPEDLIHRFPKNFELSTTYKAARARARGQIQTLLRHRMWVRPKDSHLMGRLTKIGDELA